MAQDQNRRLAYDRARFDVTSPSDGSLRIAPEYDVAEGIYDEGYGPEARRVVDHRRKVIFLKPRQVGDSDAPQQVATRSAELARPMPARDRPADAALRMTRGTPTSSCGISTRRRSKRDGLSVRSADRGQPNLALIPSETTNMSVRVVSGQETPEFQGWKAIKNHQQGEYVPTPTAIYEWAVARPGAAGHAALSDAARRVVPGRGGGRIERCGGHGDSAGVGGWRGGRVGRG